MTQALALFLSSVLFALVLIVLVGRLGQLRRGREVRPATAPPVSAPTVQEIELSQPLLRRLLAPARDRLVDFSIERTPAHRRERLALLISSAGRPMRATVAEILAIKLVLGVLVAVFSIFVLLPFLHVPFPFSLIGVVLGYAGAAIPDLWLRYHISERKKLFERSVPDTLDLLATCMDAGLSFDAALPVIAQRISGPMRVELRRVLSDLRLGSTRDEALRSLGLRMRSEDWLAFVNALLQSYELGVPVATQVRTQAAELRLLRRQRAEERGAQASLKMTCPMVGCIFPPIFIVLVGPIILNLLHKH
jgi:tight adherence protein C